MLQIPGKIDYRVTASPDRHAVFTRVINAIEGHGMPAVLLVDGGRHWVVVHNIRREYGTTAASFSIRDPWPPLPGSGSHTACSCDVAEGSVTDQLLLPHGIDNRFTPCRAGHIWRNSYVAVVPSPAAEAHFQTGTSETPADSAGIESDPSHQQDQAGVREAARDGAESAARSGWAAARGGPFTPGLVVSVNERNAAGRWHVKPPAPYYLVELHPESKAEATTLVARVSSHPFQTLELIALKKQARWLKSAEDLIRDKERIIDQLLKSKHPSWLRRLDKKLLNIGYIWKSSPASRSPFHPFLQLWSSEHHVSINPDGTLI